MAEILKDKKIILGISGGIACFKACELLRLLVKSGAKVRVVMSQGATKFVTPLSFSGLGAESVSTDMWDPHRESLEHVSWADWGEVFILAPATANIIAKIAAGIADEVLSTQLLAFDRPILVSPAMNVRMWHNFATRRNVATLREQGIHFVGPTSGHLASLITADGRMSEPDEIFLVACDLLTGKADLKGKKIIVTAGPTIERLDPVRFLSNHSSGKMGYAIASAAKQRGAEVTLISGPVNILPPSGVRLIQIESANDLLKAVEKNMPAANALIMAAAVADFRPKAIAPQKIKKDSIKPALELVKNPDILARVSSKKGKKIIVGFALETDNLLANAKKKLTDKRLDLIIANNPTQKGAEFGSDFNKATIMSKNRKPIDLPMMTKSELAHKILDEVAAHLKAKK
jgi:phosphopantothenoylcysteine decarboxylase/phosphopantothenate--cysteine ligase